MPLNSLKTKGDACLWKAQCNNTKSRGVESKGKPTSPRKIRNKLNSEFRGVTNLGNFPIKKRVVYFCLKPAEKASTTRHRAVNKAQGIHNEAENHSG